MTELDFRGALSRGSPVILDGGLATELERRGLRLADSLWSARVLIESPQTIEAVHLDFLTAGAECITSASYQASFRGFAEAGIGRTEAIDLLRRSVELASSARTRFENDRQMREADSHPRFVAASLGPYGATLHDGSEYTGNYRLSERELTDFHLERVLVLADAGADGFACETIPQLREAVAIARALADVPSVSAWVSFTSMDGVRTPAGDPLSECGSMLDDVAQVAAIGVNCVAPHLVTSCLRELRRGTDKPLVVYPNVAGTWDATARKWTAPDRFDVVLDRLPEWMKFNLGAIGGCCGTRPEDIQALSRRLG